MSDKIQHIKEEIEKELTVLDKTSVYDTGRAAELNHLLLFIDSLPEEHNEDLEEAARKWEDKVYLENGWQDECGTPHAPFSEIGNAFMAGAEWQKQKYLEDSLKSDMTMPNKFYEKGKADAMNEMKETLQTEYEKGRSDKQQEMMKDAVYGYVSLCHDYPYRRSLVAIEDGLTNLKYAEKVKIIICKTEQQ